MATDGYDRLPQATRDYLTHGAQEGDRNNRLFAAGRNGNNGAARRQKSQAKPDEVRSKKIHAEPVPLPKPLPDGTVAALDALFRPGQLAGIAEGKEARDKKTGKLAVFADPREKVQSRFTVLKQPRSRSGFPPTPERFRPHSRALAVYGTRSARRG
jgi:hypothetical protein